MEAFKGVLLDRGNPEIYPGKKAHSYLIGMVLVTTEPIPDLEKSELEEGVFFQKLSGMESVTESFSGADFRKSPVPKGCLEEQLRKIGVEFKQLDPVSSRQGKIPSC